MKNSILRLIAIIALSLGTLTSIAVTKDEMEQARAIAAKTYLRWANDASGYLDAVQAKTLDELKGQLKAKELENLKAFNKVQIPTDFASWDKDKLVNFWSVTFFNSPELSDAGKRGKSRVASQIKKMTIAAPAAAAPTVAAEEKKPEIAEPAEAADAPNDKPSAEKTIAEVEAQAEAEADLTPEPRKQESSNTGLYIAILAVLVAVVVALVVYAVNSMKESGKKAELSGKDSISDGNSANFSALKSELDAMKNERDAWRRRAEKAEKALAEAREVETRIRREADEQTQRAEAEALLRKRQEEERKREEAARQAEERRLAEERLAAERRAEELRQAEAALKAAEERRAAAAVAAEVASEREKNSVNQRPVRTIYLGRVNANGIFVRADREPVIGHSFFALTTSDGISGSFSVIDNPKVFESALADPETNLANACIGHNLLDTLGATEIITEQSGTAIFEGHCWKLSRKARIAYE